MPPEAAASAFPYQAALAFLVYTALVLLLAVLSHRLLKGRSFLKEYFLGSRGLGVWALAMSYAATSASGGSFTGFPALIYYHGWILALWIASYMIVPLCCMAILGKRLNQVARKTGAITVPDVLRDRFQSRAVGVLSSLMLAFFLTFNLVAQFKAGAVIVERLVGGLPEFQKLAGLTAWLGETFSVLSSQPPSATYTLALLVFAAAVIAYTAYGGFRAVVWTDVLQGIVMFAGVLLLLGFTLARTEGGLEGATRELATWRLAGATLEAPEGFKLPRGTALVAAWEGREWRFTSDRPVAAEPEEPGEPARATADFRASGSGEFPEAIPPPAAWCLEGHPQVTVAAARYDARSNLVAGPGFSPANPDGFLPFALAVSFFVMWAISGAGQPGTMVRLMAFRDTRVYRRAMFSVCIYYTLIYLPLVVIFVCARTLLPHLEQPDHAMPALVLKVVPGALAGIVMAAPFAAVMSTVDSFLLMISSSLVRDIYQREIHPEASPRTIRRLSYAATLLAGLVVMAGALNPPRFLQYLIVLTTASLACCFLAPMFFALYWRRMNRAGCIAGMLGGFSTCFGLYVLGWLGIAGERGVLEPHPGGFLPLVWGLLASAVLCVAGSLATRPPPREQVAFFFETVRAAP